MSKLFILLILGSFTLLSQESRFNMGLSLTGLASQIHGDGAGGYKRLGFGASVTSSIQLSETKKIKFELAYISKGMRVRPNKNSYRHETVNVHYVEVPFIWEYQIKKGAIEIGTTLSKYIKLVEKDIYGVFESYNLPYFAEVGILLGYSQSINDQLTINYRLGHSATPFRPHNSGVIRWNNWGQMHNLIMVNFNYSFQ